MAAYLCRRYTSATLRELSDRRGLSHPDSVSDLIRRDAKRIEQSTEAVRQPRAMIHFRINPKRIAHQILSRSGSETRGIHLEMTSPGDGLPEFLCIG